MDASHSVRQHQVEIEESDDKGHEDSSVAVDLSCSMLDPPGDPSMDWRILLEQAMASLQSVRHAEGNDHRRAAAGNPESVFFRVGESLTFLECLQAVLEIELGYVERLRKQLYASKKATRQARHSALFDVLTGLPNRNLFLARLQKALSDTDSSQQVLSVLFIDLDGFKRVNDLNGHFIGDAFLKIVGSRLSRISRIGDTMSRFGGDEFACLIKDADRDELAQLAIKLHAAVSQPVTIDNLVLSVKPSIGIATYTGNGANSVDLLRQADQAMYHAKRYELGFSFHEQNDSEAG